MLPARNCSGPLWSKLSRLIGGLVRREGCASQSALQDLYDALSILAGGRDLTANLTEDFRSCLAAKGT